MFCCVFSRAQLLCITDSKAPFRWEIPVFFVVFGDFVWLQKSVIFQKQILAAQNALCLPSNTNCLPIFQKLPSLQKKLFCSQPPPKHFFFFSRFTFSIFFIFSLFLFFPTKKIKTKVHIFLSKKPLLTPWQTNRTPTHYVWFLRYPKNTIKLGKNQRQNNISWTKFWPNLGPNFDSRKTKSWTKLWHYS